MDAEHRHELKTNELAEGLKHLPQLLKDNVNTIIGVVLIAVALITWPLFNKMSRQKDIVQDTATTQKIQMLDQDIYNVLRAPADDIQAKTEALSTLLVNAQTLLDETGDVDNPNLAALAQIKAAQAIRTELHLRGDVEPAMLEEQIQKAKTAYEKALETAQTSTLKAMAQFGLGLCAEELGQAAQAKDIYTQILAEESYQSTALPRQAQQRLDGLDENMEVFNFADVPVAAEPAAAEPETAAADALTPTEVTSGPASSEEVSVQAPAAETTQEQASNE